MSMFCSVVMSVRCSFCVVCVHVCRLQKIVKEALKSPAKEVTLTARFFAEIFTRVTVVSYNHGFSAHMFTRRSPEHLVELEMPS